MILAFAAAGAGIGAAIGGTFLGVSAAGWGWSIGSFIGNQLLGPNGPDQHTAGPQYSDQKILTSAYGKAVGRVWGTYPVAGNVIWKTPLRKIATTTTQSVGKGVGGQTVSHTSYAHLVDVAILLCEGPIIGVTKIKFNGELKYNVSDSATSESVIASSLNAKSIRIYTGSETQSIDPLIQANEGDDAPAYRGYAYMVLEDFEVTEYGGAIPQIEAEVVSAGSAASTLAISAGVAVGTTAVISTLATLGRNGNVWGLGTVSNTAVRVNYYAASVQTVYTPPSWGYQPFDLSSEREAWYGTYGGQSGFLHEDGTVTEYTNSRGILGSGGVAWVDEKTGYAQGDSVSGLNFFAFTLNDITGQVDETLLSAARSAALFKNGAAIPDRCYVYGATNFAEEVGYVTPDGSKVLLFTGSYSATGLRISRDGYLWMARQGASTNVEKRDQDGTLIASITIPSGAVSKLFEAPDGYIWAYAGTGAMYGIHPALHTIVYTSEAVGTKVPLGFAEDGRLIFYSSSGGTYYLHVMEPIPRVTPATIQASTAIGEILQMAGLAPADYSVATLTDTLRGFGIFRRMPARAALDQLLPYCRAELVESDDVIKAVKRGGAIDITIDEDDLGAHHAGDTPPEPYSSRRLSEAPLPRELVVEYLDTDAAYDLGAQPARRWTVKGLDTETLPTALAMTATEAIRFADTALGDRWTERMLYGIALPRKYARLEPTSRIRVPGISPVLRIVAERRTDGLLQFECVADDSDDLAPTLTASPLPAPSSEVSQPGPTVLRILDIPLLRDVDDDPGFYVAACGYFPGWAGAELWVSEDNGVVYSPVNVALLNAAVIGSAASTLANFTGGNILDDANTVDVQLIAGELPASGAIYLGGELIEYQTKALVSTLKYRLSRLRRGRKGTEQYMGTHATGEPFVLLTDDTIYRIATPSSDIGAARLIKAVSFGQNINDAAPIAFTLAANGLECLSAVNLRAGRTANASWNITISWDRRTRISGEWRNYVDAPLGEASAAYEVDIYDSSFTTLKRTLTGLSSTTATYTSANQVTDFGTNQTTVYVRVYQLSATVGRGFVAQGSLPV